MSPAHIDLVVVPTDDPVAALFTTRQGGVSGHEWASLNLATHVGDAATDVRRNRQLLCGRLGLDPDRVAMLDQVHGTRVVTVDEPTTPGRFVGELEPWPQADAMVSRADALALIVQGADCLPVLIWRRNGSAVAAAHAGWRGLVGGVIERAAEHLVGDGPLAAAVGPGIGPCCYEVSAPVRDRFASRFGGAVVRGQAVDLAGAAQRALRGVGVDAAAIWSSGDCTCCAADRYFSYRRAAGPCGRQAGVIWRPGEGRKVPRGWASN